LFGQSVGRIVRQGHFQRTDQAVMPKTFPIISMSRKAFSIPMLLQAALLLNLPVRAIKKLSADFWRAVFVPAVDQSVRTFFLSS
jgi:hypothetical protein